MLGVRLTDYILDIELFAKPGIQLRQARLNVCTETIEQLNPLQHLVS
jgi:hypothetical protein